MATTISLARAEAAARREAPAHRAASDRIVLALDGRPSGNAAAAVGHALAREWGASVHVLSEHGRALDGVVDCARTNHASLVVLGLTPLHDYDCEPSAAIALRLMRRAGAPVLAVAAARSERPRCAIAVIDFSGPSLDAARLAARVLQPGGTLYLAHVQPDFSSACSCSAEISRVYRRGISGVFESLVRNLSPVGNVRLEPVVLDGAPLAELNRLAERVGAEMLALGAADREIDAARGLLRLTMDVLREGRLSVLSVPPSSR